MRKFFPVVSAFVLSICVVNVASATHSCTCTDLAGDSFEVCISAPTNLECTITLKDDGTTCAVKTVSVTAPGPACFVLTPTICVPPPNTVAELDCNESGGGLPTCECVP